MKDFSLQKLSILLWIVVLLLVFYLRVASLFANTFHADEALFAGWARHIAVWKDPLLLTQPVDKPPLLFYLQALFFPLQGPVEWAARLPNFIASLLTVPLTAVFFQHLYKINIKDSADYTDNNSPLRLRAYFDMAQHKSALKITVFTTALIITCSPIAIQFSSTAFTDPLLTLWIVAALVASCRWQGASVNPLAVGVFFGLALATKYQAWLFLPLILGVGWLQGWHWRNFLRFIVGAFPVLIAVVLWEWVRTGTFSLWSTQINNFGGVRVAWSWEIGPRLLEWWYLWQTAVPLSLLFLFLLIAVGLFVRVWFVDDENGRFDLLLILFLLSYFLFHWLFAIPVWDRYLLPLVPIVAVLFGRGVMVIGSWGLGIGDRELKIGDWRLSRITYHVSLSTRYALRIIILFAFLLFLIPPALDARNGRFPVGGQRLVDQGATQIAEQLADAPYGTVLYDHWYSWQWGYHLFDKRVFVSWFPNPDALVENLFVFQDDPALRYIALPNTAVSDPIHLALNNAGFSLQPIANEGMISLFKIVPDEELGTE